MVDNIHGVVEVLEPGNILNNLNCRERKVLVENLEVSLNGVVAGKLEKVNFKVINEVEHSISFNEKVI